MTHGEKIGLDKLEQANPGYKATLNHMGYAELVYTGETRQVASEPAPETVRHIGTKALSAGFWDARLNDMQI